MSPDQAGLSPLLLYLAGFIDPAGPIGANKAKLSAIFLTAVRRGIDVRLTWFS
jgi:hypothetical protein